MTLREFVRRRELAEKLQSDLDRSAGAEAQMLAQLKAEFDVGTETEAAKLLAKERKELEKDKKAADEKASAFDAEFKDKLEEG